MEAKMRLSSRREYAAYLQEKFESYFKDFSRITGKTKEELILKYCGEQESTIEDMYSIDTILNFLADYGSYYLYELNKLEETSADEDIEKIRKKLEQIDKEYDILERLIYDTGEKYIIEKEEGKIKDISLAEKEKAFLPPKVCSSEDMEEISKWIRYSYYIFVENYRNKLTSLKAGKSTYNFEISEENICHLLGIEKRNLEHILKERNITIFKILQMLMNDGEKINGKTSLEVITKIQREILFLTMKK